MNSNSFITQALPLDDCITFVTNRHITLSEALKKMNLPVSSAIEMEQTHQDHIEIVSSDSISLIPKADALITTEKNIALIVRTADCLPILIHHPNGIAGIHAGRKSTELKILEKVLTLFKDTFNAHNNFHIYFGPHICKEEYEINPTTHEHYDLRQTNLNQLNTILSPSDYTLHEANICTKTSNDTYYSYRKEGKSAGRFYSGILRR